MLFWAYAGFFELTELRFDAAFLFFVLITDLDGFVAVFLDCFLSNDDIRKHFDDGDWVHGPVGREDLSHARFSSDDGFHEWILLIT